MRKFIPALAAACLFINTIAFAQSPLKPRDPSIKGSQTFAIVLGVSKYKYVRPLAYADKDAMLFKDYLKSPGGGSVQEDNIFMLLNDKASNANFWGKGFQWLKAKKLQRGDRLFIYLAGHGDAIDEDQFFFLGYDCNPAGDKNNYLVAGAIQLFNLKKKIADETTKGVEVFFIMDACRSNELPGGVKGQNFLNTAVSEKKAGEMIMLATGAGQESLEDASIGNGQGLFTYYLVDGLSGLADSIGRPDNRVTFQEIQRYVNKNVPSIALQRFKRKQDPYFCCNENSDKVISNVDTAYLNRWLRTKQRQKRGPGNSFNGVAFKNFIPGEADTLLIETYNLFNRALGNNRITGNNSAEEYFNQLNNKYPWNPYTLDAKSSLAVEYIEQAQARIDKYLLCGEQVNQKEKETNSLLANQLERAIAYVKEDDEDFANSLLSRLFLLRAGAANSSISVSINNAMQALAIHPDGAYAMNRLALLHLENKQLDSALIYADRAVRTAPNWLCAFTTLNLIRKSMNDAGKDNKQPSKISPVRKGSFGGILGGGLTRLTPKYRDAPNSNITAVNARDNVKFDLGLIYQFGIGKNVSIRPGATLSTEGGELIFETRLVTGGQVFRDTVQVKNSSVSVSIPVIIYFSQGKIAPYLSLGPSFNYILSQNEQSASRVPVKKSAILGDVGFGAEIPIGKSRLLICPEFKYTQGLNNQHEEAGTEFTNNLSALKKRGITFSVFLRGK